MHKLPKYPATAAFLGLAGALAIPASAAVPADLTGPDSAAETMIGARAALHATDRVIDLEREPEGPFVPIVGEVDYGTPENGFGAARYGHVHSGQDMFAAAGTTLVAPVDAVVADTGSDGGQGNYAYLYDERHDRTYVYMHMIEPAEVEAGDRVRAGERVGGLGCTGSCWGDHLHFEIRAGKGIVGEAVDPRPELERWRSLRRPL